MFGMKGVIFIYVCLWCKIVKINRWNMEFDLEYCNKFLFKRILQEVIILGRKKGNIEKYLCEYELFLKVDLDNVVLDELYLFLYIMDVLINNLVREIVEWDKKENFNKRKVN